MALASSRGAVTEAVSYTHLDVYKRQALTGVSLCDADSLSVRISKRMTPRPRPVLLSIYLLERGENFVSGALPQVAASGVLRRSGTASGNGDFTE